jgi:hypothetical protein
MTARIRRVPAAIVEFVAADRALAWANIGDLLDGLTYETPEFLAANDRVTVAEEQLPERLRPPVDRITGWWNKSLWIRVWDLADLAEGDPL